MKKKIILLSCTLLFLFMLITMLQISNNKLENRFFSDIVKFNKLEGFVKHGIDPDTDKYLGDIDYVDSYTKSVVYNGDTYNVYAYTFKDIESAKRYFENCTGKDTKGNWNYSCSSNYLFSSRYIAFCDNCLYRVEGNGYRKFVKAINYINEDFELTLKDLR